MALPLTPALPSCVGAPSESWQKVRVGSGAEWVFCYKNDAYIAVKQSVNYGTIQTVRTSFCALRFDPVRLFVDQGGLDFSSTTISSGIAFNGNLGKYKYAPWLFAAECTKTDIAVALGDLSDTPFSFFNVSAFHQGGASWTCRMSIQRDPTVFKFVFVAVVDGFCPLPCPTTGGKTTAIQMLHVQTLVMQSLLCAEEAASGRQLHAFRLAVHQHASQESAQWRAASPRRHRHQSSRRRRHRHLRQRRFRRRSRNTSRCHL
jgi:hypothetical protein